MHNMKTSNDEFKLTALPKEAQDPSISSDDFKLVQADAKIHDQKFETKPTTFLKDCLHRFAKNKSSVVATVILGVLVAMSIFVPMFCKTSGVHETDVSHPELYYLQPKLFNAGTGFWDGTKKMVDIVVDTSSENKDEWGPDYERYNKNAVSNLVIGEEQYTKTPNKYARGGYVQFGYFEIPESVDYVSYAASPKLDEFDLDGDLIIDNFVTFDLEKLEASAETSKVFPEGYVDAENALFFSFSQGLNDYEIQLTDYALSHDVGGEEAAINVTDLFREFEDEDGNSLSSIISNPQIEVRVKNAKDGKQACTLIKSINIKCDTYDDDANDLFESYSFVDGNDVCKRTSSENGHWANISKISYSKDTSYLVRAVLCSFTYDTYEAVLGSVYVNMFNTQLDKLVNLGYLRYDATAKKDASGKYVVNEALFECTILNPEKCPLVKDFGPEDVVFDQSTGLVKYINCEVYKYKMDPYNLDKMPKFLLGTDVTGRDMFIYVFEGLRTSLLLGVATTIVCFLFGLFWGSVSGYFGGAVDLIMERFTDILAGVPWIVVMTLTIIKLGSNFFTFALALCLTGWIGTAATTRTQFYRFRGREYVLASRTLGASNKRLIAKHILPNAMGTIITSAVLMVPSVIFSEATISYLGLGFKNLASLGVILSDNQIELTNHPYLLIFPSIIIALLMISFNLFGNGLRDAVNPSLKGEGE